MEKTEEKTSLDEMLRIWAGLPPQEQRRKLALNNCIYFGETYIKPYDREWNCKTADFHVELIDTLVAESKVVYRIPFEHAKSTWVSIVFPIWNIVRDPDIRQLLLAATPTLVQKFLQVIKRHIENNELIHRDFPYVKPSISQPKWSDTQINVERSYISKDPTIEVAGMGGSILGGRFNIIIGDDVANRKNMNTGALRDWAEDWWLEDVESRLMEGGKLAYVGTLQHWDDLGCRLEGNPSYKSIVRRAVVDWEKKKTLWEDKFPFDKLMKIRKSIGAARFNKVYQNNKEAIRGRMLKTEWLHYYNPDVLDVAKLRVFMAIDPAIGEKKENDFFAIGIGGYNPKAKKIYIIETFKFRADFPTQVKKVREWFRFWNPEKVFVESQAYQAALAQQLGNEDLELKKRILQVVQLKSKDERFETGAVSYENGTVEVNPELDDFIDQWSNYPKVAHDDVLEVGFMLSINIRGGGENECEAETI